MGTQVGVLSIPFVYFHLNRKKVEVQVKLSEMKIDPDFRDCLPKLSSDEYEQLEKNILKYGIQTPLIIWRGYIVDGHNRYDICFRNHIMDVPVREEYFEDKQEAIEWILENQLGRRNVSDFSRNEIALRYKEVIARKAKAEGDRKRSENYVNQYGEGRGSNDHTPTERTREEVAKIAGTNGTSVKRTEFILKHGTEEEIERARKGGRGNRQGGIVEEIKKRIVPDGMKMCSRCQEVKPLEDFSKNITSPDGRAHFCKKCDREDRAKRRGRENVAENDDSVVSTEKIIAEMYSEETKPYTAEMLLGEIKANSENYISLLRNMILDRQELLTPETKELIRNAIHDIVADIAKIQGELL